MTVTLDARPLLDAIRDRGGIRTLLGLADDRATNKRRRGDRDVDRHLRAYNRMRASGRVTVWAADQFCVKVLGTLPELVYGEAFFDGCDDGEVAA